MLFYFFIQNRQNKLNLECYFLFFFLALLNSSLSPLTGTLDFISENSFKIDKIKKIIKFSVNKDVFLISFFFPNNFIHKALK